MSYISVKDCSSIQNSLTIDSVKLYIKNGTVYLLYADGVEVDVSNINGIFYKSPVNEITNFIIDINTIRDGYRFLNTSNNTLYEKTGSSYTKDSSFRDGTIVPLIGDDLGKYAIFYKKKFLSVSFNVFDDHIGNTLNPHKVDKYDVGLGDVTNDKQATEVEFVAHETNHLAHGVNKGTVGLENVPNKLQLTYNKFNAHIQAINPHGVTKEQVGLGKVTNDKQATEADFVAHEKNIYNPHKVTRAQIGLGNVGNFAQESEKNLFSHTDDIKNPHQTNKIQIGLGNVTNDKQSTEEEFDLHVTDHKNPHNVTKEQVGLGDVENGERLSENDLNNHISDIKNPHKISNKDINLGNVIPDQQATKLEFDLHTTNYNDPHELTKEQIGLGDVENERQATEIDFRNHMKTGDTEFVTSLTNTSVGGFSSGVLFDDSVFCVPYNTPYAKIYNVTKDTEFVTSFTNDNVDEAYRNGILLQNNKIFCIPHTASSAKIYDIKTNTEFKTSLLNPIPSSFSGGVLLNDGKVFCIPYFAKFAEIYDSLNNKVTVTKFKGDGTSIWGGILLNDGKIFFVSYNSSTARIYDIKTETEESYPLTDEEKKMFYSGILLPDGKIFHIPYSSQYGKIIDSVTNLEFTTALDGGDNAFWGGVLLEDGRIFCVPFNAPKAKIYDPPANPHHITKENIGLGNVDDDLQTTEVEFLAHKANLKNPHDVSPSSLGLGNVINQKQVSATVLSGHMIDIDNPHKVTKELLSLGNVDNTSDREKPVSDLQKSALQQKLDRKFGDHELISNDSVSSTFIHNVQGKELIYYADYDGTKIINSTIPVLENGSIEHLQDYLQTNLIQDFVFLYCTKKCEIGEISLMTGDLIITTLDSITYKINTERTLFPDDVSEEKIVFGKETGSPFPTSNTTLSKTLSIFKTLSFSMVNPPGYDPLDNVFTNQKLVTQYLCYVDSYIKHNHNYYGLDLTFFKRGNLRDIKKIMLLEDESYYVNGIIVKDLCTESVTIPHIIIPKSSISYDGSKAELKNNTLTISKNGVTHTINSVKDFSFLSTGDLLILYLDNAIEKYVISHKLNVSIPYNTRDTEIDLVGTFSFINFAIIVRKLDRESISLLYFDYKTEKIIDNKNVFNIKNSESVYLYLDQENNFHVIGKEEHLITKILGSSVDKNFVIPFDNNVYLN